MGQRSARGTSDGPHDEIEVFPTGGTVLRAPTAPLLPRSTGTDAATLDELPTDDDRGAPRGYHARPGRRPGATPGTTSARAGGDSDIVRPLLVAPVAASRLVLSGAVFAAPLPHLRIDDEQVGDRFLVWAVTVVGEHVRPTPATLHLLGSPSMVVTVLELVPARRLRWGRDHFVRYGIEAIDELAHRIERAA